MVNTERKYELTDEIKNTDNGKTLHRIRATKNFRNIKTGDLGGFIEKEDNPSHDGLYRFYNNAMVYDNADISGRVKIFDNAAIYNDDILSSNPTIDKGFTPPSF